jgi:tetratricopeptide (TPR) repeat protein
MKNRIAEKWQVITSGIAIVTLLLLPGLSCAQNKTPAYERWGITKPVKDNAVEQQLATTYNFFYNLKFDTAKVIYQQILKKFPNSAEAHLGLSMVERYIGNLGDAVADCQKALALDPAAVAAQINYADLLAPYRGAKPKEPLTDSARYAIGISYYEKALNSNHPLAAYAHIGLFGDYLIGMGDLAKARQQLIELGRKGYFPPMLKEYAHNLLVSVQPDAILFTQGDNDTYPLLSLQEYDGVRKDVSVVNINLLNLPKVVGLMRDSLKVPISYSDSALNTIESRYDTIQHKVILMRDFVIANIIENARKQNLPVYFSTTVARENMADFQDNLVLDGVVYRVVGVKTKDSTDIDKVIKNVTEKYRLDNIGQKEVWPSNLSPITRNVSGLGINYLVCYNLMAEHYKKQEQSIKALDCYRRMFQITEAIGNKDIMKTVIDKWLEFNPEDPEVKKLKEKYLGGS